MQKPFDLVTEPTLEQLHLESAANFIYKLFFRNPPIEPKSQRLVTIRPPAAPESIKVWRLHWKITEEYRKSARVLSGLRVTRDDVKHCRRYVADIYQDGKIIDYVITPEQPTSTRKEKVSL